MALSAGRRKVTARIARHSVWPAVLAALFLLLVAPVKIGLDWAASSVTRPISSRTEVRAAVPVASDESKKGVCVWVFAGVNTALGESRAAWYLTWSTTHLGIATPRGAQFVPMVRDAASVTRAGLAQAEKSARRYSRSPSPISPLRRT